jgi:class 3 adenylate cyclase/tetratricopeptide (TPR) repeat protein
MALCTSCGTDNPERAKFCLECGAVLAEAGGSRPSGTRKLVTVLFADVVGSTSLGERLDPETMRAGLARYFTAARTVLERHGGTVEKFIGDAVMAVFGIPLMHEDDALRAVRAAVELRDEIARLNEQLSAERGLRVEFRIGVNSGTVVAGGEGSGSFVTGDAVNVAARLEQAAGAGEIFIGEATHRLVRDYVVVEALPALAAKGKSDELTAWRLSGLVLGLGAAVRSAEGRSTFVGRRRELSRLSEAFEDALAERRCFLFTLLGSAGVGKSRLVAEFIAGHAAEATVLRGRCLPYGEGITYWPVAEIVRAATGATDLDDANTLGQRITEVMSTDQNAAHVADLLTSMLGLSTISASADERSWAVRRFLETAARGLHLICLVEDIHWAEPALLDLLENVADWTREAPIMLLCTARPELLESRPTWGGGKVNTRTILLEPLNADATRQLVDGLLGSAGLDPALSERILSAAEGNPLFAEEIVRMLADDAQLASAEELNIPTSVQAVIAARLDRLPVAERTVAERASVAGRVFERGAVLALVRDDERELVPAALLALMRKELVQPSQPDLTGDEAFRFRHMLIRDTAYDALPKQERASLHERFAGWIERVAGERLDEYAEIVGYHLELAVRYRRELGLDDAHSADLAERAGERLNGAGTRAYQRGDDAAAVKLLGRSVELLPAGESRREALLTIAMCTYYEEGVRRWRWATERLADEARAVGDELDVLKASVVELRRRSWSEPEFLPSSQVANVVAAREKFEQAGDALGVAMAEDALGVIYLSLAHWGESGAAARRGLEAALAAGNDRLADDLRFLALNAALWGPMPVADLIPMADELIASVGSQVTRAHMMQERALAHAWNGDAAAAHADLADALLIERDIGDPELAWAFSATPVEMVLGDAEAAEREVISAIRVLERMGETGQRSTMHGFRARILFDLGRSDAEITADVEECRRLASADDSVSQLQWRAALALVAARAARIDEAKRWIEEGAAFIETGGCDFVYEQGLTAQDRGYIYVQAGELDVARRWYERALELFEQKGDVMDAARVRQRLAALS